MGGLKVDLKVAFVNGNVPLLVSRGALGKMGMLLDVAENRASFKALGVKDLLLENTETGTLLSRSSRLLSRKRSHRVRIGTP